MNKFSIGLTRIWWDTGTDDGTVAERHRYCHIRHDRQGTQQAAIYASSHVLPHHTVSVFLVGNKNCAIFTQTFTLYMQCQIHYILSLTLIRSISWTNCPLYVLSQTNVPR